MKRSVKSIAAAAAAFTMALSCVPTVYAAKEVPAVQAEEEKSVKYEFTEGRTVKVPYNGTAMFADDDGTVYYSGYDSTGTKIFSLNKNGRIKNSYNISNVNDKGEKISVVNAELKQCGDHLYLIYSEADTLFLSTKKNVIVKLDKELNEIERYSYDRKARSIDTNGEKVVYIKGNSIYVCGMNGKNKKLLYTVDNSDNTKPHEQPLNSVAIAGNYVGFQKRTGYSNSPDRKEYCGIIDIKTGGITLHKQRSVQQVFSSNGNLVWYGEQGYYPQNSSDISADAVSGGAAAVDNYFSSRYKYYSDSELYVFDGENYSVIKTSNAKELGHGSIIDNEGNLITTSYDGKGNLIYRIYRSGKLLNELTVSYKGYCGAVANNGVLTICYDGYIPTADDWIGYDPSAVSPEEVQAMMDEQAAKAAKLKEMYPMRSVTYSYK